MKPLRFLILPLVLMVVSGCRTPKPMPDLLDNRKYQNEANQGDAVAQYNLGSAYASHWQTAEANSWYLKSARKGYPDAQYRLGVNYLDGIGLRKDPVEAYAWFDLAAAQGQILAMNARVNLAGRMTQAEVDEGNHRAAELIAKIPTPNLRYGLAASEIAEKKRNKKIIAAGIWGGGIGAGIAAAATYEPEPTRNKETAQSSHTGSQTSQPNATGHPPVNAPMKKEVPAPATKSVKSEKTSGTAIKTSNKPAADSSPNATGEPPADKPMKKKSKTSTPTKPAQKTSSTTTTNSTEKAVELQPAK